MLNPGAGWALGQSAGRPLDRSAAEQGDFLSVQEAVAVGVRIAGVASPSSSPDRVACVAYEPIVTPEKTPSWFASSTPSAKAVVVRIGVVDVRADEIVASPGAVGRAKTASCVLNAVRQAVIIGVRIEWIRSLAECARRPRSSGGNEFVQIR